MKKLLIAGAVLLAVLGIALWLVVSNLDTIVKRVVEEVGSDTLGTKVSLNSVEISLGDARAALRGLTIANPDGFETDNAFELGAIEVTLDPESISTDVLVLDNISIDQAGLTFEQVGDRNNLQTLLNNLDSGPDSSADTDTDSGEENQLIIREFSFTGANIAMSHDRLENDIALTLPDIRLRNIGTADSAVTPQEAARQIIEPILQKSRDAAQDRAEEEIRKLAEQELDKQKDRAKESARKKLFGQ